MFRALILLGASFFITACDSDRSDAPAPTTVKARLQAIRRETVPALVEAPGSVQPQNRISLASQLIGFVREVRVRPGDRVTAGQILVLLDARDVQAQRDAAESQLAEARAAFEEAQKGARAAAGARAGAEAAARLASQTLARFQKLAESRSVSVQELDEALARRDMAAEELGVRRTMALAAEDRLRQAESRIAQANAQIRRADVYVGWSVVRAPTAGVISARMVDPGSAVFPGTPLLNIDAGDKTEILANLPVRASLPVKPGLAVRVRTSETDPSSATGRVTEVHPVSSPGTHTIRFKVQADSGLQIPVGGYVRIQVPAGERSAVLVPRSALVETGQITGVFVVDARRIARYRLVKVIPYDKERLEILSGLSEGEEILLAPPQGLSDGTSVEVFR